MLRHRFTALLASAALLPLATVVTSAPVAGAVQPAGAQPAPRAATFKATIDRTKHGIPHITAKNFADLGFGSGYAAAETSICTLADTLLTGRGQRSRWFGPNKRYNDQVTLEASNLQVDAFVTDLHNRKVVEELLADKNRGPGKQARKMVKGYTAGVNRYLADVGPKGVGDPACRGDGYLKMKARPIDLWYGVYLANMLASSGVFVKEIVDAAPPSPDDPGNPNPTASAVDRDALLTGLGRDPEAPFGSNATAVGGDALDHGQGHVARQPALSVARPLPLHPAAPHDPRQVRRRRCLADRVTRSSTSAGTGTSPGATRSPRPTGSRRTSTASPAPRRTSPTPARRSSSPARSPSPSAARTARWTR